MLNLFLIFFVLSEFSFYLLIAQTGIVEVFNSDIYAISYLPLGGIIASYFNAFIKIKEEYKVVSLLFLQILISFLYPHLTPLTLFLLGIAVGGVSPMIIQTLKKATLSELGISLGLAYILGTLLFTTNPMNREILSIILSLIALVGYIFAQEYATPNLDFQKKFYSYPLVLMVAWVFLDASLFETLSRDSFTSIWRGGYSMEIILFHLLGIFTAIKIDIKYHLKSMIITSLFLFSYLFYFMHEAILLSIVYPFVISYYNIVILQSLIKIKSLKRISVFMVFIGWLASGTGLFIAIHKLLEFIPLILPIMFIYDNLKLFHFNKGVRKCLQN